LAGKALKLFLIEFGVLAGKALKLFLIEFGVLAGKGMSILSNSDKFYVNMYVMGDQMLTSKDDNGQIVYGAPVAKLITQTIPVSTIPASYTEVCQFLKDVNGKNPDPDTIRKLVRYTGWEEAMPSWTRAKWGRVMDKFGKCASLDIPDRVKHLRDSADDIEFTDFVIVHQTYAGDKSVTHQLIAECIRNVLKVSDNVICPITAIHKARLHDYPLNMKHEFENAKYQSAELKKQFDAADFDVQSVNNCLKGSYCCC
jgi:hypothetical protein